MARANEPRFRSPSVWERIRTFDLTLPALQRSLTLQPTVLGGRRGPRVGVSGDYSFVQMTHYTGLQGVPIPVPPTTTRWTHSLRMAYAQSPDVGRDTSELSITAMTAIALGRNQVMSRWDLGLGITAKAGSEEEPETGDRSRYTAGDLEAALTFHLVRPGDLYDQGLFATMTAFGAGGIGSAVGDLYFDNDYGLRIAAGGRFR